MAVRIDEKYDQNQVILASKMDDDCQFEVKNQLVYKQNRCGNRQTSWDDAHVAGNAKNGSSES